jgi:hypothetical protein
MPERKKLELQLNIPCPVELLYDQPTVGNSQYGEYYLYSVRNGDGTTEYSFFAPIEVHEQLRVLKKGDRATILKLAEQKGSKIVTKFEVAVEKPQSFNKPETTAFKSESTNSRQDNYYDLMLQSCNDAVRIQGELGGMMDAKSLAVTLFIARSRVSQNGYGG